MKQILAILLFGLLCTSCGVRDYHHAANNLRAVIEVEGLEEVPEPHKTALQVWAEKRDPVMEPVKKIIEVLQRIKSVAEKMNRIRQGSLP